MFDSSIIREIAGGEAVKCNAVKPSKAPGCDVEGRGGGGHLRKERRRKEQDFDDSERQQLRVC